MTPNAEWRADRRVVDLLSTLQSPRLDFAQPQAQFRRRGLVQSGPLHEPDHFIDVRKLLAKSGSPSRRHPMHCQHRHQLRSLTLQRHELSLDRGWPPAFDGCDRPPSLRKERTHKHLPPTTCRRTTGSTTCPKQLRGHWGAMKAAISVVHKRENGGASFKLRNTNEAPRVQAEAM